MTPRFKTLNFCGWILNSIHFSLFCFGIHVPFFLSDKLGKLLSQFTQLKLNIFFCQQSCSWASFYNVLKICCWYQFARNAVFSFCILGWKSFKPSNEADLKRDELKSIKKQFILINSRAGRVAHPINPVEKNFRILIPVWEEANTVPIFSLINLGK